MSNFMRTVRLNGRDWNIRVEPNGSSSWKFDAGEGWREASVLEVEPGLYSVLLDGGSYQVSVNDLDIAIVDPRAPRASAKQAGAEGRQAVTSPMPGKVVRVLISEGEEVERGQGLVVIEAMKMQNELKSPKKGRVVAISAVAGATVGAGDVLVAVE